MRCRQYLPISNRISSTAVNQKILSKFPANTSRSRIESNLLDCSRPENPFEVSEKNNIIFCETFSEHVVATSCLDEISNCWLQYTAIIQRNGYIRLNRCIRDEAAKRPEARGHHLPTNFYAEGASSISYH